ncbi:MAG: tRNA 2-selenouridine(34) synthase MnmH [Candidatus Cloacimonetes bacterium]|nr:tRNA 2-selenouridine(34) synthase MnmH [Candidatus Cloacimonadota bacterium]
MKIEITEFLKQAEELTLIDVRTTKEYEKGHIPKAFNIPLFTNEERAEVGTRYKQESRDTALVQALEFIAPKVTYFLDELQKISPTKEILLYCWRGGLRSAGMAKLFEAEEYKTTTLIKGYRAYRNYIRQSFEQKANIIILGGMTGTGKTDILREIENLGEQVLDLEKIAHHKGSAFGSIGQEEQPTNEQFENNIFERWNKFDLKNRIWIEDESQLIGKVSIPDPLFDQIRSNRVINIELAKEIRIERLVREYSNANIELLKQSIKSISKRLGGLSTKLAIESIEKGDFRNTTDIVLTYYDKAYNYGLTIRKQQTVNTLKLKEDNPEESAKKVIDLMSSAK